MKLLGFKADNYKRLKVVELKLEGQRLVTISGRNNQGKSSLIDAVEALFGDMSHVARVPVRAGEDEARLYGDVGEFKITKVIKKDRSVSLIVEDKDGKRMRTPQTLLDKFTSEIAFDPMEFMNLKASDRIEALKKLIPEFNFAGNAKARQDAYDRRTDIGRDYKRYKANLDMLPLQPDKKPAPVDVAKAVADLKDIEDRQAKAQMVRSRLAALAADIMRIEREVSGLKEQLKNRSRELLSAQEEYDSAPSPEEPGDPEPLRQVIAGAQAVDRDIQNFDRHAELKRETDLAQSEIRRLDGLIEDLDDARNLAIRNAKLPVDGLGFGEEDVTIDGLPFEQASSSMQLTTATGISMALKPTLRVILVRQGPLLDADHLDLLKMMAEENDYLMLVERIDPDAQNGIIIEDGEVVP